MIRHSLNAYPKDWPLIALRVKEQAGWHCIRCGHRHDFETGHVLTVHHLDMDPANSAWWNLAALCQKCHLHIQAKVILERIWMFEHSSWFKPYVAGYYAHRHCHPTDQQWVMDHLEFLLEYGKPFPPSGIPADQPTSGPA